MPLKKEPCRNFQRGSCRYGDRCKFLHVTQQQPKSNAFGFGSQTSMPFQQTNLQQQKPNPFGFGVQNSGPPAGASTSRASQQPNGFKPFENKWVRPEQSASQSQAASHTCTDPDSCKRLIAEDFEQERPLWKLTCYGHYKYLPCDISGELSYEELRAAAYDEGKRGINLQSIVERERNLLNSKLIEFENLLRNPYTKQIHPAQPNQNPFPAAGPSTPSMTAQNPGFAPASSFTQQGSSPNMAFGVSTPSLAAQNPAPAPVSSFTQLGSSPNMAFGVRPSVPSNNAFGQFQSPSGAFGSSTGPFGSQAPAQIGGSPFTSNTAGIFGNSGTNNQGSQPPSTSSVFPQTQTPGAINHFPTLSNGLGSTTGVGQMSTNVELVGNVPLEVSAADASIWLKEEWKLGEIPEQPPPAAFVK